MKLKSVLGLMCRVVVTLKKIDKDPPNLLFKGGEQVKLAGRVANPPYLRERLG